MNPALLKLLQQQQLSSEGFSPEERRVENPFDKGISRAIESARESLGMTQKQQDKALRSSMLAFASNMSQQPREKGFFNNFASVGRALNPAIQTYDQEENAALSQNNNIANQILQHQVAEQERAAREEEKLWRRGQAEAQLGEQKRYHNLLDNFNREKMALMEQKNVSNIDQNGLVQGRYVPFQSTTERAAYAKELKGANHVIDKAEHILKQYEGFENLTKDNAINPLAPYGIGSTVNTINDASGYFTGNKEQLKQTEARKSLEAANGRFVKEFEKAMKGGILTKNMIQAFRDEGLLPDKSDPPQVFKAKLADLLEEAKHRKNIAFKSLQYNAHVDTDDEENQELPAESLNYSNSSQEMSEAPEFIIMEDPNGGRYSIPSSEVNNALNDGLVIIE